MSDDEFEDEPELDEEDLDEEVVIEEEFDDALLEDEDEVEDPLVDAEGVVIPPVVGLVPVPAEPVADEEEDDDVVDLDEELHPDDVEEALDVVLRERTVAAGLEGEDDDDEPDEPGEGGTKIVPRRENEFLCRSCFLVLPRHQLADEKRMICRDCA
ncbi:MAG: hypothetical protein QOG50_2656 [Actinomycetota bacterium]|jgi:hypothetical protein|nr:hypothetical protein [Actinomycetota bacterium]